MVIGNSVLDLCLDLKQSFPPGSARVRNQQLNHSPSVDWASLKESLFEQDPPKFPPASSIHSRFAVGQMPREYAISILEQMSSQFGERTRQQKEAKWLRDNRARYAGLWIAIEGDELLAAGPLAKDVFAQVAHRADPPLVMQIESATSPFAGW